MSPGPAQSPLLPTTDSAQTWGFRVWLAGVVVLATRLILAALALNRLIRRSSDASADVMQGSQAIAQRLGCFRPIRVVRSREIATPCLAGLFHPVLMLPEREDHGPDDLPAILAHELAHARNRDLAWNLAAHLASIGLWFHPLAWRIRSAHAAACDAVSDAVAADYLGDVASYGRTLARLAVHAARRTPAHVLAMARTSDVLRRLDALNRRVFQSPLSGRQAATAFLIGGALLVLIGGLGFTRAEQSASKPATARAARADDRKLSGKLTLHAVAAATHQPIEGVSIKYRGRFAGRDEEKNVTTGKDGLAAIDYATDSRIEYFEITARKAGLVPIYIFWDDKRHPVEVPPLKELRFERGTAISGIVKDQAGQPVAGAKVELNGPPTECEAMYHSFSMGSVETDARGRWTMDVAPKDLSDVSVHVHHPRYRKRPGIQARNVGSPFILTKGLTVTGRVIDAAGRPVKGASVHLGDAFGIVVPTETTNDRGEFALENCEAGPNFVIAQSETFSPQVREVRVKERTAPVVVTLSEPAGILRGKIVDLEGKPIVDAFFGANTWRGRRLLKFYARSGADGRVEWRGAPRDVVFYGAGKYGYMSSREFPLTASEKEQLITLFPELVINGRVTDAETGRPLPRFRLVRGRKHPGWKEITWAENEAVEIAGDRYSTRFDEPCPGFFVRVEAPGYEPAESRAFHSTDKTQTCDFALRRGEGLSGVVLNPDGKPAAGAEVILATKTMGYLLQAGRYHRMSDLPMVTTGPDGRFAFTPPKGEVLVVAAGDAGYADATLKELEASGTMVLQAWGKIEGEVRIGGRPAANQDVTYAPGPFVRGTRTYVLSYGYHAMTDDRGRFRFDRVVPGRGTAWRELPAHGEGPMMQAWGWQVPVEVKPGQTARVRVGGNGRAVIGRIVLDGKPETPVDWAHNETLGLHDRPDHRQFATNLDKDGRFRIEDVPPGLYVLQLRVNGPPEPDNRRPGAPIGWVRMALVVPEPPGNRPDLPFAVGSITAKLFPTLKVGEPAPDFDVERLAGKGKGDRLTLGDEQGKLVLLDFWTSWDAGSSPGELATLKEIQQTFGNNPRFRLIGLWCDREPATAERTIKELSLAWPQGYAGQVFAGAGASYKLRATPATFLIGPDGRILAKDLRGAALKEAVAVALKDEALFRAKAWAPRPGRFPVTRFGVPAGDGPAQRPMVVVLDDCDQDFREARPHHDALRILRAAGGADRGEVKASIFPEFNTCETVGEIHSVAIDRQRGRIYVCEMVADCVVALDFQGRKLWRVDRIHSGAVAVDPRTGNVWCTVGNSFESGETVVLDRDGEEVASFPVRGVDIAYDPHTAGFWLVGFGIRKISREGQVLFEWPRQGWASTSVSVDSRDGSVWVVERAHRDVARSANRLWHFNSVGGVLKMWPLGNKLIFGVACDPNEGTAWVVNLGTEILRFTADGRELPALPIAARAIAISPTTGQGWTTTETEIIGLGADGRLTNRIAFGSRSGQSWLAAY